jgi:hypothetical protein
MKKIIAILLINVLMVSLYASYDPNMVVSDDKLVGGANYIYKANAAATKLTKSQIYDNGNVGIGSADPQAKLDVAGNITTNGTITATNYKEIGTNTLVGSSSGNLTMTGAYNICFGASAGSFNTTGNRNIFIGPVAGSYRSPGGIAKTTGDYGIYLGYFTIASAEGTTNEIVIGSNATGLGSDTIVLGGDAITKTALKGNVGIGTTNPDTKVTINGPVIQNRGQLSINDSANTTAIGTGGMLTFTGFYLGNGVATASYGGIQGYK